MILLGCKLEARCVAQAALGPAPKPVVIPSAHDTDVRGAHRLCCHKMHQRWCLHAFAVNIAFLLGFSAFPQNQN